MTVAFEFTPKIERGGAMRSEMGLEPPCIIDVEASGFGPESYPIEIGLALNDGGKFCTLILPSPLWTHWDRSAEKVHRIPRDILEEYGRPRDWVTGELNRILRGKTVYTDGWVVDKPWLNTLFDECGATPGFETSSLEMILSEGQMEVWHETKDRILADGHSNRHRASFDAWVVQQTWMETRRLTG